MVETVERRERMISTKRVEEELLAIDEAKGLKLAAAIVSTMTAASEAMISKTLFHSSSVKSSMD